jgi:hypothetical protein
MILIRILDLGGATRAIEERSPRGKSKVPNRRMAW